MIIKILKSINSAVKEIRGYQYILHDQMRNDVDLTMLQKLHCLGHGFALDKYEHYQLSVKGNWRRFLPDSKRVKTSLINKPYDIVLNDKSLFHKYLEDNANIPAMYGYIVDKQIVIDDSHSSSEALESLLAQKKNLIIKRSNDGGGKGVYRLSYQDGSVYLDSDQIVIEDLTETILESHVKYLVSEFMENGEYSKRIYDRCTNTIRFTCIRDPFTKESLVLSAYHKFGSKRSHATDNYQQGGVFAGIDMTTGIIDKGYYKTAGTVQRVSNHPDTNVRFEGVGVPNWKKVVESVRLMLDEFEFIDYVGWDVIVHEDGIRVIEGNNNSGLGGQFNYPFLDDSRMVRFLKYHKIIR